MQQLLAVGIGGFVGAVTRWALTGMMQRRFPAFTPAGTLLVNVIGCLAIGLLMALFIDRKFPMHNDTMRLLLTTGFLGGLTTFSAFGYETVELLERGDLRYAFFNVAANLVVGLLSVWIGLAIGRLLMPLMGGR